MGRQETVTIKCFDHCTYTLAYPDFFLRSDKPSLRKLFKWLFQFYWKRPNEDTLTFFDRELPELESLVTDLGKERIATAKQEWQDHLDYYHREYKDPKEAATPDEKRKFKEWNAARMQQVKYAKAHLGQAEKQAQKDLERAKEVIAIYLEAKNKYT